MVDEPGLGPMGTHSQGKINEDDEGDIKVGIATDKEKGVVMLHFGKPITWLGLDRKTAIAMGNLILRHAHHLR